MPEEKFGIKETKEWFTFLIGVGQFAGNKISEGKSLGMMDLVTVMPILMDLKPAIENSKMVGKEVFDLSDPEKEELKLHIESLEVPSEIVERSIEKGLKLLVDLADFVGDFFEEGKALIEDGKTIEADAKEV